MSQEEFAQDGVEDKTNSRENKSLEGISWGLRGWGCTEGNSKKVRAIPE